MGRRANSTPLTEDQSALAAANVGLVYFVVRKMAQRYPRVRRIEDQAMTEGFLALVRAARGYDPAKGAFSTYACACVWSAVAAMAGRWFRLKTISLGHHDRAAPHQEKESHTSVYEMARLWLDGVPAARIGEMVGGMAASTVRFRCRELGLPKRTQNPAGKRGDKLFERMWMRGDSLKDISRVFGMLPQSIQRRKRRLGLPARPTCHEKVRA